MSLVFKIDRIDENGVDFRDALDPSLLTNHDDLSGAEELEFTGPIEVSGRLEKVGEDLLLKGRVSLKARAVCTRCGDEAVWPLDSRFEMVLLPKRENIIEGEHEISAEEFSQAFYEGPEVDVSGYFREQIALEWPMQILCRPDCKGLCPSCGANLNSETCSCEKVQGDLRLADLRQLKIESSGRGDSEAKK